MFRDLPKALNPTPMDKLVDGQGRPYFLWDVDVDLAGLQERLRDPNAEVRAHWMAKVLREAKPDDALRFFSVREIRDSWDSVQRYLGRKRMFWQWLIQAWEDRDQPRP